MLVMISSTVFSGCDVSPEAVARNMSPDKVPHGMLVTSALCAGIVWSMGTEHKDTSVHVNIYGVCILDTLEAIIMIKDDDQLLTVSPYAGS